LRQPRTSTRNDLVRLRHIFDHASQAIEFLSERRRSDLDTDRLLQLATTRLLGIISEAATRVTREGRALHPAIP
jgi:uncharacterized protein with HEPN domain